MVSYHFYILVVDYYIQEKEPDKDLFEIANMKNGQSFGHIALLSDKPRNATILATDNCSFAVIKKKAFKKFLGNIELK